MAIRIKGMNFQELVAAENAATAVRKNYEDRVMMFRGIDYNSLKENEKKEQAELAQKLATVNAVRLKILAEMEKKLLTIESDD